MGLLAFVLISLFILWLRRRRKRRTRSGIPFRIRDYVMMRDRYRCVYCGKAPIGRDLHLDHVMPWSRGGDSMPSNLVVSCANCNLSKGDKTPEEWRR
jgi:5-methylcytosine-specific restriction endonuclease McrA